MKNGKDDKLVLYKEAPVLERQFDLTVEVSQFLEGGLLDWPPNVQDKIFHDIETRSNLMGVKLYVVGSRCTVDVDKTRKDGSEVYFLHVILSDTDAANTIFVPGKAH